MEFYMIIFNYTALMIAVQQRNIEVVRELLTRDDIDIGFENIYNFKKHSWNSNITFFDIV